MSWYAEQILADNQVESIVLIITDMRSEQDFQKIKEELLKVNGVLEVKRLQTKKVQVICTRNRTRLEYLVIALKKTGYSFLNRACINCRQV